LDDDLRRLVQARLGLEVESIVRIERGWDSTVFELNGEWIVRVPRRAEVREWLRKEAALLPLLAPELPVPVPEVAAFEDTDETFFLAYHKLPGEPLNGALQVGGEAALAGEVGSFLAALHAFPGAARTGLREITAADWLVEQEAFTVRCEKVLRLLDESERRRAEGMFARQLSRFPDLELALLHADLGAEHILCRGETVTGVIDWSDARVGDPALDFAWLLHGAGEPFAQALLSAYTERGGQVADGLRERALYFHRLGPWHEVLHGLETNQPELVSSGLAGVRKRLP